MLTQILFFNGKMFFDGISFLEFARTCFVCMLITQNNIYKKIASFDYILRYCCKNLCKHFPLKEFLVQLIELNIRGSVKGFSLISSFKDKGLNIDPYYLV